MIPQLIPYRKKDKWGFADRQKQIVIPCVFDDIARPFSEENVGLALVKKDHKTAWINAEGTYLSPFADITYPFTDYGISVIVVNAKIDTVDTFPNCFFIDPSGKIVFENDFLTANRFANGKSIVMNPNRMYGVVDAHGNMLHSFETEDYIQIWEKIGRPYFYDCITAEEKEKSSLVKFENEHRYIGYKDQNGQPVISAKYYKAADFSEGWAAVAIKQKAFFYIDEAGQQTLKKTYYYCGSFHNGIAPVVTHQPDTDPHELSRWDVDYYIPSTAKWGYIDKTGTEYWED